MRKKTALTIGDLVHECARLYRRDFEKRARSCCCSGSRAVRHRR